MPSSNRGNQGNQGSQSTQPNKPAGTPDDGEDFQPTLTPDSVEIDLGPVGLEANSDGTVGISIELPVPGLPGVTASGGITFDPATGEIVETEFGAEIGPLISINVAIAGCEITTTITIGLPNSPLSISYTIPGTMPNCEVPEEPEEEEERELEPAPPTPEPYDPPTPAPNVLGEEWHLVTFRAEIYYTYIAYYYTLPDGRQFVTTSFFNDIPDSLRTESFSYTHENKLWVKAPLNLDKLIQVNVSKSTMGRQDHYVFHRIFICGSGLANVGPNNEKINEQTFPYKRFVPRSAIGVADGFSQFDVFKSVLYLKETDWNIGQHIFQRLQTYSGGCNFSINGKGDPPKQPKLPPAPPPELIMDNCCSASTRMLREIYEVLDPKSIKKTEIPKNFCYPGATGTLKLKTYDKILEAMMLQANLYGFQPFQAKVADANAGKEGNQPIAVAFNSLSGNLKFQTELGIENAGDIDTLTNICVRLAQTLCIMQKATLESYRRLEAIEEFLDFDIKQVLEDVPMMFDPRAGLLAEKGFGKKPGQKEENTELNTEKELARFLQSSNIKTKVITNTDKRTLRKIMYEIRNVLMANNTGSEVG
jgi:hypothetical protein